MNFRKRTHNCGELRLSDINKSIVLNGWASKIRNLGGLLFIDVRDRYGITQVRVNPEDKEIYDTALNIKNEFVISVSGNVIERESKNTNIATGEIEIDVDYIEILNESLVPPFVVEEDVKASEDLRLKYRYLDLRRKSLTNNLIIRNKVYQIVHNYYGENNFIEVETPILMKSTPEGARDYLVPSRVHKGKFYALPQSPQTYKQILMVSGLDRYVQICKCFRDEDLRADRQPEFTQIDVEMSFVDQEDIFKLSEGLYGKIWREILNIDLPQAFRRMTYDEALETYGSDKPDLRLNPDMKIHNISSLVKESGFKVFTNAVNGGGIVAGICIPGKNDINGKKVEITRKIIDNYTEYVKTLGMGGLAYIKIEEGDIIKSPVSKFLDAVKLKEIAYNFNAKQCDTIFICSGSKQKVLNALGQLRLKSAEDFDFIQNDKYEFIWITDFPLFRFEESDNRFYGEHHVFTSPKPEFEKFLDSTDKTEIESIRANCYDLVVNGSEIGSGSIRNHRSDIQSKVFKIIGLTEEEADYKFGFLLDALKYGAPPHGGVAFGFDRIIAILCGLKSIRDVIAFPKTMSASSLMDDAPSTVEKIQLTELGISIIK